MASIVARNVSVVYPLVGSDRRHIRNGISAHGSVGGTIRHSKNAGIIAIDDFNIGFRGGDRLGIFGHNGCGKTTLLRVLAGIYPPTSGEIHIQGKTAGMFSLTLGVNKEATGLKNIEFKGLMHGMTRQEIADIVPEIAEFSELGEYLHLPVKTYSSGMVMRLMFATASMMKPDILLLDEWVSAGDSTFTEKSSKHLDRIISESKIVIVASQNEPRLRATCNKLVHLENGRTVTGEKFASTNFKPDPIKLTQFRKLSNLQFPEEALAMVGEVWPEEQAPVQFFMQTGSLLMRLNQLDSALQSYAKALNIEPDNPALHNILGRLYFRMNDANKAFDHIMRALNLSKGTIGDVAALRRAAERIDPKKEMPDLADFLDSKSPVNVVKTDNNTAST